MARATIDKRLVVCVTALTLVSAIAATAAPRAQAKILRRRKLAPGVSYTSLKLKGPNRARVVSIDRSRSSTVDVALANNRLPGLERTSSMARRRHAIVAINGDYAQPSGRPVMAFAEDGHLIQTAFAWGRNFALGRAERVAYVGHPSLEASVEAAGAVGRIAQVNGGPPNKSRLAEYSPVAGAEASPPRNACAARLVAAEPPRLRAADVEATHKVGDVRCSARRMRRLGGVVVASRRLGRGAEYIGRLIADENVALRWNLGWPGVLDTVGGNPRLVRGGRVSVHPVNHPFFDRHPRTGVGVGRGRVFFVVVDGRRPRDSVGMTPQRFARLFVRLGARTALNLDGGGSTTMAVNGHVKNRPSDGRQRPVSSALLLLRGADRRPSRTSRAPQLGRATSAGGQARRDLRTDQGSVSEAWEAIASDPASTGGLASWLDREGKRLPPGLERAAQEFSQAPAVEPPSGEATTLRLRDR